MKELILQNLESVAWLLGTILAGVLLGLVAHFILWQPIKRLKRHTESVLDDALERHLRLPSRFILMIIAIQVLMPLAQAKISAGVIDLVSNLLSVAMIVTVAWLLIKATSVFEDVLLQRFEIDVKDNLRARQVHTQARIIKRLVITLVIILAVASVLMSYDRFRELGTGLLASAGLAGLVIGFAAQRTLGNLIAGIQIALTQPIRLDDVLVVEGEWGRVEEISLTYVVVRIWDLRRLILPISYFLEKPFQNWTRTSSDVLGTIYLYVDYEVPVDAIRKQLERFAKESELWDQKVAGVQVTNVTEQTIEVRGLVSAADSSSLWSLRCEIREKLINFIRSEYPDSLPRSRVELRPVKSLVEISEQGDNRASEGDKKPSEAQRR
jgi:small-conductance mechanosensitive channel